MLTKEQVMGKLPYKSHVSLWSLIKDQGFPPPHVIGKEGGSRSGLGWIEELVDNWLAARPVRFPKGSRVAAT
jgi:predicted DNA-binding transcriptional regulator AlpA